MVFLDGISEGGNHFFVSAFEVRFSEVDSLRIVHGASLGVDYGWGFGIFEKRRVGWGS